MKQTRVMMDMPITVEIVEPSASNSSTITKVFDYFEYIDRKFSVFRADSEISRINRHELAEPAWSADMKTIFSLAQETKEQTDGFFNIVNRQGICDPSGIVKGWAIYEAAKLIDQAGYRNYYVDAGGDIQVHGQNMEGGIWTVGIQNPFKPTEIVKVIGLNQNEGVATSGTYIRGQHIYNPKRREDQITEIVSLTVIGPNVYEADRFATAAFAMGRPGIDWLEKLSGFEGYIIDKEGIATMTSGFERYVITK
jgi:thiamine biosynthesis lipoprotein